MRKYVFIFMVVVLALVQAAFPRYLVVWGMKPDLLFLCVFMAGILFRQKFAVGVSVFIGLLKDSFSVYGFPISTLLFPLWAAALVWISRKISMSDPLIRIIAVATLTFVHYLSTGLLALYAGKEISVFIFFKVIFIQTLYTTLISLAVCYFIEELLPQERVAADPQAHPW